MGYPDLRSVIYTVSQAAGLNTYQKLGFGQDGPVWMPRLFIARVPVAGYGLETATISGNLLSLLLQTGFYFASLAGYLGDRWQHLRPGPSRSRL